MLFRSFFRDFPVLPAFETDGEKRMIANFDVWRLLAGLGIFLFGMLLIEESVRAISGRAFRRIIRQYTYGRLQSAAAEVVDSLLQV